MALIEIKDFKGIATQADPNDIGLDFSINNQNFYLDTPGALVKHPGRGTGVDFSNIAIDDIAYWSPSNLQIDSSIVPPQWIGFDTESNKLKLIDGDVTKSPTPTPVDIGTAYSTNTPSSFDFQDHGTDFRIAADKLSHSPKVIQHISRKFFGDGFDHSIANGYRVDDFVVQDAFPSHPGPDELTLGTAVVFTSAVGASLTENIPYRYKISPIFDGVQELPLSDDYCFATPTTTTHGIKVPFSFSSGYLSSPSGNEPNKVYPFDPRITAMKIYRERNYEGTYYHIGTIPMSAGKESMEQISPASGQIIPSRYSVYAESFIDSYSALVASNGIFDKPNDINISSYNNFQHVKCYWILDIRGSESINNDNKSVDGGVMLWQSNASQHSGPTYRFNNAPKDDARFRALLAKGIVDVSDTNGSSHGFIGAIPNSGSDEVFNKTGCRILRFVHVTFAGGESRPSSSNYNITHDNISGVCHGPKQIVFLDLANDKRFAENQHNSSIVYTTLYSGVVEKSIGKAVHMISDYALGDGTVDRPLHEVDIRGMTVGASSSKTKIESNGNHNLSNGDKVTIAGNSVSAYNGEHTISGVNFNFFEIDVAFTTQSSTLGHYSRESSVGYLNKNIYQRSFSTSTQFIFFDAGLNNGVPQPYPDDFKVRTNYKYSQMIGDRLFVGNVRLDPGVLNEDHPDWVVYSESGMPDILPITNFIQIKDQQGGQITGMNKILDSLVVFMTRGIFRLDVTSSASPSSWSLMEADKNIGCIAPKSIISAKDNLFFASYDNIYQITPDFRFHPITLAIRNKYQEESNLENTKIFYDITRDRLICSFGDNRITNYIYSLDNASWTVLKYTDSDREIPGCYGMTDKQEVFALATYTDNTQSGGGGGATP